MTAGGVGHGAATDAELDALRAAVRHEHDRLDAWLAVLEGCLAEAAVPGDVEADPRFDVAVEDLAEADVQRQLLALEVLGVGLGADDEEETLDEDGDPLTDDVFAVNLVVAVPEQTDPARLDDVLDVLDGASDALVAQLETAGFVVRGLELFRGPDQDEDDVDDLLADDDADVDEPGWRARFDSSDQDGQP